MWTSGTSGASCGLMLIGTIPLVASEISYMDCHLFKTIYFCNVDGPKRVKIASTQE